MKQGTTKGARSLSQFSHNQDRLPGVPDQPDLDGLDLADVRSVWWRIVASGNHLPPEIGVIVIPGGRDG